MKFKELIKKKSFWAAVSGAVVIILQLCGIKIDAPVVNEIILGVCSLLVAVGAMTVSEKKDIAGGLGKKEDISSDTEKLTDNTPAAEEKTTETKTEGTTAEDPDTDAGQR